MVHSDTGDRLKQIEDEFTIAETDRHSGERTQLHTAVAIATMCEEIRDSSDIITRMTFVRSVI